MTTTTPTQHASTVADIMSRPVLTIELDESLWDAWQLMFVSGVRHLAVIDEDGSCLGVISDRAATADVDLDAPAMKGRKVRDIMARVPLIAVSPQDPPIVAAERMQQHSIAATPVIDHGRLVGIVSEADIVHWVASGL
jgi:CBS domain-containing protein